jgi:addiction module RelE/StbE family toxin
MFVSYSKNFKKQYLLLPKNIRVKFKVRLSILLENQNNPQLNKHKLSGPYNNLWSINITGDIRAIYQQIDNIYLFSAIGSHSELYK